MILPRTLVGIRAEDGRVPLTWSETRWFGQRHEPVWVDFTGFDLHRIEKPAVPVIRGDSLLIVGRRFRVGRNTSAVSAIEGSDGRLTLAYPGNVTKVIFRQWPGGTVVAVFPEVPVGPHGYQCLYHDGNDFCGARADRVLLETQKPSADARFIIWHLKRQLEQGTPKFTLFEIDKVLPIHHERRLLSSTP